MERVLKEDIAKGVRKRENNSGGKIAQEGKREDRGNMMKPGVVDIFTTLLVELTQICI